MTGRDAFLQVLRIIAAMVAILFFVMHPPSFSSGCYESPRGEQVCPELDDDPPTMEGHDD